MSWLSFFRVNRLRGKILQSKVPMVTEPRGKRKFSWLPSLDPEIYPLMTAVSFGFLLFAVYNLKNLTYNPDINVRKTRREIPTWERYNREESKQYTQHRKQLADAVRNPINEVFPELSDPNVPCPSTKPLGPTLEKSEEVQLKLD